MATLIARTTVVTGDSSRSVHHDASIAVDEGLIEAVGPADEIAAGYPNAEVVDGRGAAVFPGLINCHTHLLATIDRGILEDFGFPTTLAFPETARSLMSAEERDVIASLGALEAIRSGTTCLLEISNDVTRYARALEATGLRLLLAEQFSDIDPETAARSPARLEAGLQRSVDLIEAWHGASEGRVRCFVAPHAPENCSPELLRHAREMADRRDLGYTIHLAQSHQEVKAVADQRGLRPAEYLSEAGLLGPRLVAAHCRYVDGSETALLGEVGCSVANNAAIAARRGASAPARELMDAGCTLGMGSDNMAEDMVEVMRAGLFSERVRLNDEMWPQPEDVLEWATMGGARALGMADRIGSIEPGKRADLFIVNTQRPHLVPTLRVVSAFVHQGQPGDITNVMVEGKWLMRDSRVLTIDEADVVRRAERTGHAVWNRLVERYPDVPFPVRLPPLPRG